MNGFGSKVDKPMLTSKMRIFSNTNITVSYKKDYATLNIKVKGFLRPFFIEFVNGWFIKSNAPEWCMDFIYGKKFQNLMHRKCAGAHISNPFKLSNKVMAQFKKDLNELEPGNYFNNVVIDGIWYSVPSDVWRPMQEAAQEYNKKKEAEKKLQNEQLLLQFLNQPNQDNFEPIYGKHIVLDLKIQRIQEIEVRNNIFSLLQEVTNLNLLIQPLLKSSFKDMIKVHSCEDAFWLKDNKVYVHEHILNIAEFEQKCADRINFLSAR